MKVLLKDFKRQYEEAVTEGKEVFQMDGHDILVSYAKYLIEYLEQLKGMKPDDVVELTPTKGDEHGNIAG